MADHQLEHDVAALLGHHMYASFMVDPLGLELIDRIGVDRVMWSTDYPHNESTFGYSEKSLASVVEAVGPEDAAKIVSTQHQDVPRARPLMTDLLDAGRRRGLDIPDQPDLGRMRRERGARLRSAMADKGIDALVLLGNTNVVVRDRRDLAAARLRARQLRAAGRRRARRRRDAAPVHAVPRRRGCGVELPADHLHGPMYLDFDEGVDAFATRAGRADPGRARRSPSTS